MGQFDLPLLRLQNAGNALHKRIWRCPDCGPEHNRDVNAALNIKQKGILELKAAGVVVPAHGGQRELVKLTQRAKKNTNRETMLTTRHRGDFNMKDFKFIVYNQ